MATYDTEVLALNPVGYWRLGEASGTNAVDEGSGANDGTYTNTPTLGVTGALTGDADTAVTFASIDNEYVTMGDVLDFEHTDSFTLSAWFKTTTASTQRLLAKQADSAPNVGYAISVLGAGTVNFNLTNDVTTNRISITTTYSGATDGNWHHIVVTYDGSDTAAGAIIYIDGVAQAVTVAFDTLSATTLNATPLQIGARNAGANMFNGTIDEAAIFSTELTFKDVARLYYTGLGHLLGYEQDTLGLAPSGYWRLGEPSGTNAVDETVAGNDGTYQNTPTLGVTGAIAADADTAITCVAANSEDATIGDNLSFDHDEPFSLACWFKSSSATSQAIISKEEDSVNFRGYQLMLVSSGSVAFQLVSTVVTNDIVTGTTDVTYGDGAWHFAVATYDGTDLASGVTIYIDGVAKAKTDVRDSLGANVTTSTAKLSIGSRNSVNLFFEGSLDEPAIFPYELSAAEVTFLHASGTIGSIYNETVVDSTALAEVLTNGFGKELIEALSFEVGLGIINTIVQSFSTTDSSDSIRNQIGAIVESIQFALTQNIEHAKGVLEGLAMNEAWAANLIMQGDLTDTLNFAEVIQLTWDQLQSETVNVADVNSTYARKAAALAELFVSAGIVSNIHKAVGIIAEAIILQDLAERYFELSATDGVTLTGTSVAIYRAVVENIEAAIMADSIAGTRRMSLLISDEIAGTDEATVVQRLHAALADDAVFGGTIVLPDGVFSAIVLNTESLGISEYNNYPFNSFGKLGQDYLGASDTDIFRLTGDDDAGTDIDAVIRSGMTNFGTNVFKRVPRAYLGYTSDGGLIMKTISTSGGVKTERWYELTPRTGDHSSAAHAAARIKLGRGIKATYWQFELINKLGADFDIDSLQLYPMILSRRV